MQMNADIPSYIIYTMILSTAPIPKNSELDRQEGGTTFRAGCLGVDISEDF